MLVKDESTLAQHSQQLAAQMREDKMREYVTQTLAFGKVLLDKDTNPANLERQTGRYLTTEKFEKLLLKLDPGFLFETIYLEHEGIIKRHASCKRLCILRNGIRFRVCAYSIGQIPEYSVHKVNYEEVVNPTLKHVDRKDLPAHSPGKLEVETDPNSPNYGDTRGEGWQWHGDIPGVTMVAVPGGELIRGWRTVLAEIVHARIASPEKVEAIFGASPRFSWANMMGKRSET